MSEAIRILIVGGGGVGAVTGFNLERGGLASVSLVLRSNYSTVQQHGFTIDSCDHGNIRGWHPSGGLFSKVPDVKGDSLEPFDYVICCTKNIPDVGPSLSEVIAKAVTEKAAILLIQNGINIEKPFFKAFPHNVILSGVSFCGVEEVRPGHVVHIDKDRLSIGAFLNQNLHPKDQESMAVNFVKLYKASGKVDVFHDADVKAIRWRKLVFNAVLNPICALTNLDTSRIRLSSLENSGEPSHNIIDSVVRPAMNEVRVTALAADGVELDESLIQRMIDSDPIESFILPSMQQDIQRGRFIECENILGEVVREADRASVPTPVLKTLYGLCQAIQFKTKEAHGLVNPKELINRYAKL